MSHDFVSLPHVTMKNLKCGFLPNKTGSLVGGGILARHVKDEERRCIGSSVIRITANRLIPAGRNRYEIIFSYTNKIIFHNIYD